MVEHTSLFNLVLVVKFCFGTVVNDQSDETLLFWNTLNRCNQLRNAPAYFVQNKQKLYKIGPVFRWMECDLLERHDLSRTWNRQIWSGDAINSEKGHFSKTCEIPFSPKRSRRKFQKLYFFFDEKCRSHFEKGRSKSSKKVDQNRRKVVMTSRKYYFCLQRSFVNWHRNGKWAQKWLKRSSNPFFFFLPKNYR